MKLLRHVSFSLLAGMSLVAAGCGGSAASSGGSSTPPPPTLSATQTVLTASPSLVSAGAPLVLTATVSTSAGTPTGAVTFLDGTTSLGMGSLTASSTAMQSTATLTVTTFMASSSHSLTAAFGGDTGHASSTSGAVTVAVSGAAPAGTINAHATFSFATPNQTITGFGAAEAFYLSYLDSQPYQSEIYKALYDPTAGLGLTYLRVQNLYAGTPGSSFDPDTPKIVASANTAHTTPLTVLMSSWTPPANLKSNGTVNGCSQQSNGVCTGGIGTLIKTSNGSYDYPDYAQYWYDSLNAYAALGVTPGYISIQNEPDFTPTYVGCRFNPTEAVYNGASYAGYGLAFDAVYKKVQTLTAPPKMVGPESFSVAQTFLDLSASIPTTEVSAYATHLYNVNSGSASSSGAITPGGSPDAGINALTNANAAHPTAMKFATEYYDTPGFYNAWTIHNALVYGNDNAYIFWQAAWPSQLTATKDQSADQQGLIYVDNPFTSQSTWAFPHGWMYNDSYYALKHFSYFVRPGYVRYNATVDNTDERVSIYQSADKKTTVIVVLNVSATATDGLSLDLSSFSSTASTIYRSSFASPIATGERFANLGSYVAPSVTTGANVNGGISLPPQSAVTIVLTN